VGRHSAPHDAPSTVGRRALLSGGAVAVAVVVVVALAWSGLLGLNNSTTTAEPDPTPSAATSTAPPPAAASPASSPATTPAVTPSTTASKRPPTVDLRLSGDSYVVVRVPGGRTLVEKVLHKGVHRTFDQKTLLVVLGNSAAVEVRVNGKLLPRGGKGQVASFVATRK
jgi:hypothetical protein